MMLFFSDVCCEPDIMPRGCGEAELGACLLSQGSIGNIRSNESYYGKFQVIQTAIIGGRLEGDEHAGSRAKLVDALARLAHDPATSMRETLQACRLLMVTMSNANLRMPDNSLPRRRKPRRRRMVKTLQGEGGSPCGPIGRADRETRPGSGRGDRPDRTRPTDRNTPPYP